MKHFQIIMLLLLEAFLFIYLSFSTVHDWNNDVAYAQYPDISGIKCDKVEHFNFHYHAHLSIFINGLSYLVPGGIGVKPPDCIYWLHTRDSSGIIHIESPENNTFKLGQFFDIWGQKFNNSQIFDFKVDNSTDTALTVYLNGTAITQTSYKDIPIVNHEDIVIVYGAPPPEIPSYEFLY
jgi:hypothetical protein